ncbi:MAG: hypothetical protein H7X94_08035, partial [Vallitaleaceae bacterium]|nr:hypothetical protein [Vallitaleaceae bacterium]
DQLSGMIDINYKEDIAGNVLVQVEGIEFITLNGANKMGLAPAAAFSQLSKPIWTHLSNTNKDVFDLSQEIAPEYDNDKGGLKGLLLARGERPANYTDMVNTATYEASIKPSMIMNTQAQFDNLIHGVVTLINNVLAPNTGAPLALDTANAPYGLDGSQGIELFIRKSMNRYNATNQYNVEDPTNVYSLYSATNIEVNPDILMDYDKICLNKNVSNVSDNSVIQSMIGKWQEPFSSIEPGLSTKLNINEYYHDFISGIGNVGNSSYNKVSNQELMTMQIENQRSSNTAVSSDEELSNMIKFQHAYNAAAKVISVLDQMIEQVVQSLGLVGR